MRTSDWEDGWEPSDSDVLTASEIQPWQRGALGKGLIGDDGSILASWIVSDFGDPHHDDVASQLGLNYVAKFDIFPSGACYIPSPDDDSLFGVDREWAENALEAAGPEVGLNLYRGFTAKRLTRLGIDMQADAHTDRTHGIVVDVESGEGSPRARHATEGDLATAWDEMDDHSSSVARMATETRSQLLSRKQELEAQYPDHMEAVHTFPDGWSIQQPTHYGDIHRTGELLGNCWSANNIACAGPYDSHPAWPHSWDDEPYESVESLHPDQHRALLADLDLPIRRSSIDQRSLHDPDGLPHAVWYMTQRGGEQMLEQPAGRHNTAPKPEYWNRITQWAQTLGQPIQPNWYNSDHFGYGDEAVPIPEDWRNTIQPHTASTGSIEDELATWLDSFSAPSSAVDTTPISLHHKDVGDLQHRPPTSVAETPHIDPPSEPYEPYDWAEEGA